MSSPFLFWDGRFDSSAPKLPWRQLEGEVLDPRRIFEEGDVEALEKMADFFIFSRVERNGVEVASPELVCRCIVFLQLTCELFSVLKDQAFKNCAESLQLLEAEKKGRKEDAKGYSRVIRNLECVQEEERDCSLLPIRVKIPCPFCDKCFKEKEFFLKHLKCKHKDFFSMERREPLTEKVSVECQTEAGVCSNFGCQVELEGCVAPVADQQPTELVSKLQDVRATLAEGLLSIETRMESIVKKSSLQNEPEVNSIVTQPPRAEPNWGLILEAIEDMRLDVRKSEMVQSSTESRKVTNEQILTSEFCTLKKSVESMEERVLGAITSFSSELERILAERDQYLYLSCTRNSQGPSVSVPLFYVGDPYQEQPGPACTSPSQDPQDTTVLNNILSTVQAEYKETAYQTRKEKDVNCHKGGGEAPNEEPSFPQRGEEEKKNTVPLENNVENCALDHNTAQVFQGHSIEVEHTRRLLDEPSPERDELDLKQSAAADTERPAISHEPEEVKVGKSLPSTERSRQLEGLWVPVERGGSVESPSALVENSVEAVNAEENAIILESFSEREEASSDGKEKDTSPLPPKSEDVELEADTHHRDLPKGEVIIGVLQSKSAQVGGVAPVEEELGALPKSPGSDLASEVAEMRNNDSPEAGDSVGVLATETALQVEQEVLKERTWFQEDLVAGKDQIPFLYPEPDENIEVSEVKEHIEISAFSLKDEVSESDLSSAKSEPRALGSPPEVGELREAEGCRIMSSAASLEEVVSPLPRLRKSISGEREAATALMEFHEGVARGSADQEQKKSPADCSLISAEVELQGAVGTNGEEETRKNTLPADPAVPENPYRNILRRSFDRLMRGLPSRGSMPSLRNMFRSRSRDRTSAKRKSSLPAEGERPGGTEGEPQQGGPGDQGEGSTALVVDPSDLLPPPRNAPSRDADNEEELPAAGMAAEENLEKAMDSAGD